MYAKEKHSSSLATLICSYSYTLLDTSSLMEEGFPEFMDNLSEAKSYFKKENKVLILQECMDELKKHELDKDNAVKHIAAKRALKIIRHARFKGTIKVIKSDNKEVNAFADNVIYTKISHDRLDNKILVITQDKHLAYDLRSLNELSSQRGRIVNVYQITENGELVENLGKKDVSKFERKAISKIKKEKGKSEFKKKQTKPSTPNYTAKIAELLASEKVLNANLYNPNYPQESKLEDVKKHLALLRSIPASELSNVKLGLPEKVLLDEYSKLMNSSNKKEEKKPLVTPKENFMGSGTRIDLAITDAISKLGFKLIENGKYVKSINGSEQFTLENIQKISSELAKKAGSGKKASKKVDNVTYEVLKISSKNYKANLIISKETSKVEPKKSKPAAKKTSPLDSAKRGEAKLKKVLADKSISKEDKDKAIKLQIKKVSALKEDEVKTLAYNKAALEEMLK